MDTKCDFFAYYIQKSELLKLPILFNKVRKNRNILRANITKLTKEKVKENIRFKLETIIEPYLFRTKKLYEWSCGCLFPVEENSDILCDCPRPNHNNYRNNPKPVIATYIPPNGDGEDSYYPSIYAASKDLGVNPGLISMCCNNLNRVKTGTAKFNGHIFKYKFRYA